MRVDPMHFLDRALEGHPLRQIVVAVRMMRRRGQCQINRTDHRQSQGFKSHLSASSITGSGCGAAVETRSNKSTGIGFCSPPCRGTAATAETSREAARLPARCLRGCTSGSRACKSRRTYGNRPCL